MAWPLDAEGMGHKKVLCFCFSAFFVLICFSLPLPTSGDIATDREALLAFKKSTGDNRNLASWNTSSNSSICTNWTGITCSHVSASQRVTELQLSNRSLSGQIPLSTLGRLHALETLTLSSNHFSGELPLDLANCTSLKNISLQNNNFSGPLAASAFSTWPHLLQIDLSFNNFSGSIPQSITNATSLQSLNFENNSFSGTIPNITASSLKAFNVANNELEGQIPTSLSKFSNGSFAGNKELCGEPLNATCASSPLPSPYPTSNSSSPSPYPTSNSSSISRSTRAGLSDGAIVGIVIGTVLGGCLLLVLFGFVASNHKGTKVHVGSNQKPRETGEAQVVEVPHVEEEGLVFVDNINNEAFDMDSLLRASAEVMGKGTLGMAYKAMLEDGLVLVVKRLYFEYREDYKRRLLVLASLKHPNLIPFKAWYFSKDEKFLVYDYMRHGSLHAYLYGTQRSLSPWLRYWVLEVHARVQALQLVICIKEKEKFCIIFTNDCYKVNNITHTSSMAIEAMEAH
eukprot:c19093_g1_i2 orf=125-1663(-)